MNLEKELREIKLDLRIEKRETEKKSGIGNIFVCFGLILFSIVISNLKYG